jgi:hypothetical protein
MLFRLAELLLLLVPVAGVIIAGLRVWQRSQRPPNSPERLEPERVEQYRDALPAAARGSTSTAAQWRTITRTIEEHARTDARWLDYELDVGKLLDFPLMTDMRDPLTTAFHKAKIRADLLRPAKAEDLLDDRESAAEYLAAVGDYVTTFDSAEAEAIRRRRTDFSQEGQQRIARARNLLNVASDAGATPSEREQAYALASKELDGLIVLPATTRKGIERRIAGQIDG